MDEIQKTEMRNYAMAAGFFVIATQFFLQLAATFLGEDMYLMFSIMDLTGVITAFLLLLAGVILIVLKNRDLTAITFFMTGMLYVFLGYSPDKTTAPAIAGIFLLILAAVILTAKDRKKYLLAIIPALMGLSRICVAVVPHEVSTAVTALIAVVALYFAFACASERIAFPGGAVLKADVATDFKASGSVLGYLLFGTSCAVWTGIYFLGIQTEAALAADAICGMMLISSGILLFAVGKMRFTPIMFILMGFLTLISQLLTGPLFYVVGAMFIVLGLFALLRNESRILPGIMLILYGVTYFVGAVTIGSAAVPVVSGVLNLIVTVISVYLAFAVFSQNKRLPLF